MTDDRKPQKQVFCGFLNVLKPPGMSSAQAVGRVKRLLAARRSATPHPRPRSPGVRP